MIMTNLPASGKHNNIAGLSYLIGSELASPLSEKNCTDSLQLKRSYTVTDTTVQRHSSA